VTGRDDALVSVTDSAGISSVPMATAVELIDAGFTARHLLPVAVQAVEHAEAALVLSVRQARADGLSWRHIGDLLGVTAQAAHQRFSKRV
jgi:hypothetical protein